MTEQSSIELGSDHLQLANEYLSRKGIDVSRVSFDIHDGRMDLVEVVFRKGKIRFVMPRRFSSTERRHFHAIHYFLPTAAYLSSCAFKFSILDGTIQAWIDDLPFGSGLAFTGVPGRQTVLCPDPLFLASDGYSGVRSVVASSDAAWGDRSSVVFWRGVSTGYRSKERPSWRDLPRFKLCEYARQSALAANLDVGVSHVVQIGNPTEVEDIAVSGLLKEAVQQEAFLNYKFAIDIDGNTNSWPGLLTKLLFGNTVIKVQSEKGYSQWYYDKLVPWFHFVPVRSDLSDLEERVQWLLTHDDEADAIASNGQSFARALTVESTFNDFAVDLFKFLT